MPSLYRANCTNQQYYRDVYIIPLSFSMRMTTTTINTMQMIANTLARTMAATDIGYTVHIHIHQTYK